MGLHRCHADDRRHGAPLGTFLDALTQRGYVRADAGYTTGDYPPLEITYSEAVLGSTAAKRLGIEKIDAYILQVPKEIRLGMEKTAAQSGLRKLEDIEVLDFEKHPLIEITERLMMRDRKPLDEIERKGMESE